MLNIRNSDPYYCEKQEVRNKGTKKGFGQLFCVLRLEWLQHRCLVSCDPEHCVVSSLTTLLDFVCMKLA